MTDITELAQREKFEAWFKSSFHPDKTGPYIKDQLYFAWKAASAELVEALEKAQETIAFQQGEIKALLSSLESRTVTDWIEHDGKWRPGSLGLDELVYLKTRKQELKIPYPAGKVKGWMNTGGDMDVMAYKLASPQASTVTVKLPKPHAHLIWIQAGHAPDDYWDDVAVSHSEKDRCCDGSERYPVYARWEIEEMLAAAGIKVEAE